MSDEQTGMGHHNSQDNTALSEHGGSGNVEYIGMEKEASANSLWAMDAFDPTLPSIFRITPQ